MKFTFPDEKMRLREVVICLTWPQGLVRKGIWILLFSESSSASCYHDDRHL